MTEILYSTGCPNCGYKVAANFPVNGNLHLNLMKRLPSAVPRCHNCQRNFIVDLELEAHVTTRKIETEEGGKR